MVPRMPIYIEGNVELDGLTVGDYLDSAYESFEAAGERFLEYLEAFSDPHLSGAGFENRVNQMSEVYPNIPSDILRRIAEGELLSGEEISSGEQGTLNLLGGRIAPSLAERLEAINQAYVDASAITPAETGPVGGPIPDDNRPNHGRPDRDEPAVEETPTQPIKTGITGDPKGKGGAVTIYKDRTHIQDGDGYTGHGTQAPVILDLDGDGVEVAFGEDIYFDLDDDGFLEQTSWAAADDGFLVIDKLANDVRDTDGTDGWGDGVIDQSNELVLSSLGLEGDTDLQALARYDDNGDGKLDARDAIWNELKVWQELNQDGKTEGDGTAFKAAPQ